MGSWKGKLEILSFDIREKKDRFRGFLLTDDERCYSITIVIS